MTRRCQATIAKCRSLGMDFGGPHQYCPPARPPTRSWTSAGEPRRALGARAREALEALEVPKVASELTAMAQQQWWRSSAAGLPTLSAGYRRTDETAFLFEPVLQHWAGRPLPGQNVKILQKPFHALVCNNGVQVARVFGFGDEPNMTALSPATFVGP